MTDFAGGLLQSAAAAPGTGSPVQMYGMGTLTATISGTFTGLSVTWEGTENGTVWAPLKAEKLGSASALSSTATATGVYAMACANMSQVRANVTAISTGSVTISSHASSLPFVTSISSAGGGVATGVTVDDGADTTQGSTGDAAGTSTVLGQLKQVAATTGTTADAAAASTLLGQLKTIAGMVGLEPVGTGAGTQAGSGTLGTKILGWLSTLVGLFQNGTAKFIRGEGYTTVAISTGTTPITSTDVSAYNWVEIQLTASPGTVTWQCSPDGTNWDGFTLSPTNATQTGGAVTAAAVGTWVGAMPGLFFRLNNSSGNAVGTVVFKQTPGSLPALGTTTAFAHASAAGNSATITKVVSASSAGSATIVKSGGGILDWYTVANKSATAFYLKFYDTTSLSVGTNATKLPAILVPAGSEVHNSFGALGAGFTGGIGLGMSALFADSDTTQLAAGDGVVAVGWK